MNIAALIEESKHGSQAAQRYLFDKYAGNMRIFCCRYVKSTEDAEELMLDGFYKFFRSLAVFQYKDDASVRAFIKKIMLNECLMFLRRKNVFSMVTDAPAPEAVIDNDALDRLSAGEILKLILQLPIGYRTVFNLYEMEGFSHTEIAKATGISEGTSRSQLSKAKSLLQKLLSAKSPTYVRRKEQ